MNPPKPINLEVEPTVEQISPEYPNPYRDVPNFTELASGISMPNDEKITELGHLPELSTPDFVRKICEATGLIAPDDVVKQAAQELLLERDYDKHLDQRRHDQLESIVSTQNTVWDAITKADAHYREDFWNQFESKRGLDLDKLEELHDNTEAFNSHVLIKVIKELKQSHGFGSANLSYLNDAERIIRIIFAEESGQ